MLSMKLRYLISCCTISHRKNLYYQYNYNVKIEELLNKQIQAEQQAAQNYLKMAVTFLHPSKSLNGAGGFFMKIYEEEIKHMHEFIHYQIMRGGITVICGVEPPKENENLTLLDAFKHALKMEKEITKQIEDFIKVAEEVKDRQCAEFLTTVFLVEQLQSIHEMATHVTKLTPMCNNEYAVYHYDLELAKQYPYPFKTK